MVNVGAAEENLFSSKDLVREYMRSNVFLIYFASCTWVIEMKRFLL